MDRAHHTWHQNIMRIAKCVINSSCFTGGDYDFVRRSTPAPTATATGCIIVLTRWHPNNFLYIFCFWQDEGRLLEKRSILVRPLTLRSNIQFAISLTKCLRLPRNDKKAQKNARPQRGLKCWPWSWPWPWMFKLEYLVCYNSDEYSQIIA